MGRIVIEAEIEDVSVANSSTTMAAIKDKIETNGGTCKRIYFEEVTDAVPFNVN